MCERYVHNAVMIYGYARVSTDGQSVEAQIAALTAAGAAKVYRETASGAKTDRARLRQVLAALVTCLLVAALVLAVGRVLFDLRTSWMGLLSAAGVLALGVPTLVACGLALAATVPDSKAVAAVGLGILLPLGFLSDVFYPSAEGPAWMGTVGSVLPLKHITNSLSAVLDPGPPGVSATSLAVIAAWLVGGGLLAWRGFSWGLSGHRPPEGADESRRQVAAGAGPSA